ncbi:MAG: VOC family protein [Bacteroidota bacterium]
MSHIIPLLHCTQMTKSVAFYTRVLDFKLEGTWPETGSPAFSILKRLDDELHLSSHSGTGSMGAWWLFLWMTLIVFSGNI